VRTDTEARGNEIDWRTKVGVEADKQVDVQTKNRWLHFENFWRSVEFFVFGRKF
jgi:hypothetical protein